MSNPRIAIDIIANDKSGKGIGSAEKGLGRLPKAAGRATEESFGRLDRATARSGRSILSTFSKIERASAGIIGGTGGGGGAVVGRLSAIGTAGEAAAGGLGEAAAAGGLLEAALGTVAVGGAIAAGVIAGVAYATDKLASGWAKNVVGASNYAAAIGVATKSLQEFQAAGERAGIDKNTAAGALGGLSNTLNDARFGKNATAAGTLAYLGVKMKLNPDGTVDTVAMLPAIQAALQQNTSYGARQIGGNLGLGEAGTTILRQGRPIGAEMADAGRYANVAAPGEEAAARRYAYQRTRLGQMAERAGDRAGAGAASMAQGVLDQVAGVGASTIDTGGRNIVQGAQQFSAAVIDDLRPAVREMSAIIHGWAGGGRFNHAKVDRMARGALPLYRALIAHGDSPATAAAWAANGYAESSGNPHMQQPGTSKNAGYGLFQWDAKRRAKFAEVMGKSIYGSSTEDQLRFRDYEVAHDPRARRAIAAAAGPGAKAEAITRFYEGPAQAARDGADRSNVADAISRAVNSAVDVHHHVTVTVKDERGSTHATVKSRRGDGTPIFHAFARSTD